MCTTGVLVHHGMETAQEESKVTQQGMTATPHKRVWRGVGGLKSRRAASGMTGGGKGHWQHGGGSGSGSGGPATSGAPIYLHDRDQRCVHVVAFRLLGVQDLHGVHAAGDGENGAPKKIGGKLFRVQRGGRHDELEVLGAALAQVLAREQTHAGRCGRGCVQDYPLTACWRRATYPPPPPPPPPPPRNPDLV